MFRASLTTKVFLVSGFKVIGSVCDQTGIMAAAVNRLISPHLDSMKQSGTLLCYCVDGNKIIHCFDPPHILKTLRNNFLVKNLRHSVTVIYEQDTEHHRIDDVKKTLARWDDLQSFHEFDTKNTCRLAPKITNIHINPENDKMKVSLASQIFSKTLGSVILFCSQQNLTPSDYSGTAYFLLFVNNLFDSLNGGGKQEIGTFRGPINESNKLKYYKFWEYAISKLEKMDFIDKENGAVNNRSTVLLKTISTVRGYMELTKTCLDLGVASISLRQMNQDGLENFFGSVRSVCHSSKSPIASLFRPGYTNLILSNLTSQHSIYSNCEDDGSKSLLKNVCDLYEDPELIMNSVNNNSANDTDDYAATIDVEVSEHELVETKFIENDALTAASNNAYSSIFTSIHCDLCKEIVQIDNPLKEHRILQAIGIQNYPSSVFIDRYKLMFKTIETVLPYICHEKQLFQKLISSLNGVDLSGIGCTLHESVIVLKMKRNVVNFCVSNFIKQINGILTKKIIEPVPNQSVIHEKAFEILKKKRGIGKHGQKMI